MPVVPLGNPRVSVQTSDGWEELPGVIAVGIGYDPPDPIVEGYGTGEIRGLLEWTTRALTPEERALSILAPYLARCPLYRGV